MMAMRQLMVSPELLLQSKFSSQTLLDQIAVHCYQQATLVIFLTA